MTEKTQPTDAELLPCPFCGEAATHSFNSLYGDMSMASCKSCGATAYAPKWNRRAVLEKWGQPAQAEEPFCWHWENTFNGGTGTVKKNPETLGINMVHPDHKWTALYTAPQPTQTQAGAVPLTDAQIAEMMRDTWGCASIAPRHALEFARAVERAHGIAQKGGS